MKVTTEQTIWCERCSVWHKEPESSKPKFIRGMRLKGWRTRLGKTVCPWCVKELSGGRLWADVSTR